LQPPRESAVDAVDTQCDPEPNEHHCPLAIHRGGERQQGTAGAARSEYVNGESRRAAGRICRLVGSIGVHIASLHVKLKIASKLFAILGFLTVIPMRNSVAVGSR
jgi:hypothetical protein